MFHQTDLSGINSDTLSLGVFSDATHVSRGHGRVDVVWAPIKQRDMESGSSRLSQQLSATECYQILCLVATIEFILSELHHICSTSDRSPAGQHSWPTGMFVTVPAGCVGSE